MSKDRPPPKPRSEPPPPHNPDHDWMVATGFRFYGGANWMPLLIELQDSPNCRGDAQSFADWVGGLQAQGGPAWAHLLRVPRAYLQRSPRLRRGPKFITVLAHRQFLDEVKRGGKPAASIRRYEIGRAVACGDEPSADALPPDDHPQPPGAVPKVIVGIVDEGIAFAHDRLRDDDHKTRVEYLWDQRVPPPPNGGIAYGRWLSKHHPVNGLDRVMADHAAAGRIDEDAVYCRSGFTDRTQPGHQPLAARASHGAHVADLACSLAAPPAPGLRPVIAVDLPPLTVADTSGATLQPQIVDALHYLVGRADALAARHGLQSLPLVVNISYGLMAGPHDGTGLLEAAIDDLLDSCDPQQEPMRVVLPAGNSRQLRGHARFSVPRRGGRTLPWRVLPDDRTASHLEIWLPADADPAHFTAQPVAPDGSAAAAPVAAGQSLPLTLGGVGVGWISFDLPPDASRPRIKVTLDPTTDPDGQLPLAPAGLWRVRCRWTGPAALKNVLAWIQRDDTAPGHALSGRQSYFDDPGYPRFDVGGRLLADDPTPNPGIVHRRGTISAMATGRHPLVVAGFRGTDRCQAPYISAGSAVAPIDRGAPSPHGPEASLPVDGGAAHRGLPGAGTRSGSCIVMQGSSVAAPLAAAQVADWLAAGLKGDRHQLFQAAKSEDTPPKPPPKVAPEIGGGGRLTVVLRRLPR